MRTLVWLGASLAFAAAAEVAVADPYRHTIVIDGVNDFASSTERFATTTFSYYQYTTWDDSYLYSAYSGPSVAAGSAHVWVVWYLDTLPGGTSTGILMNTQQPILPPGFDADYRFAWRTDGAYCEMRRFNGSAWVDAGWDLTGDVAHAGSFVECRLSLASLGSPQGVRLISFMVKDAPGDEWTWAGMPSNTFTDGYNPNPGDYLSIDFASSWAPNAMFEPGACCFADGHCETLTQATCLGLWAGADTTCATQVCPLRGDLNCDGAVDFDDISPFVAAVVSRAGYESHHPDCRWLNGDIDGNGDVDFDDISPFVKCLVNNGCP